MGSVSPVGLIGRLIAAVGAVMMGASLFLDISEGDSSSFWDALDRMDIVLLVLAVVAVALLGVSLVALEVACLFLAAAIGGYGLGFFSQLFIEESFDKGIGTWLANVGSVLVVLGAGIALLTAMLRRPRPRREPAFEQADTEPAETQTTATPTPAETPAPAAPTVAAGWYPDPSGQARLRYWNGETWTEQTQE